MTKVLYNGEYIDLCDKLEKGFREFDFADNEEISDNKKDEVSIEDTKKINVNSLEDTTLLDLGDLHE